MTSLLDVHQLRVTYGGVVAVDGASLAVEEGQLVGLIGPNGAGKTSMIDALTGYHAPSAGRVVFAGTDVTAVKAHRRSRMGLVRTFQSVELFDDLTVDENLLVAAEHVGPMTPFRDLLLPHRATNRESVEWALDVCGLTDAGLAHLGSLGKLRELNLMLNVGVTDRAVPSLSKLQNLKMLDLTQTGFTDAGVQQLRQALPACRILHLATMSSVGGTRPETRLVNLP